MEKKILHLIDTDYRTNILVPYDPMQSPGLAKERWGFIGKTMKVLPKEAQHYPILSLGIDDELGEIFGYFVGGAEAFNLINASLNGDTLEDKAQFVDSLITGKSKETRQFFSGKAISIGYLLNTSGEHYNPIFGILEKDYNYQFKRAEIRMKNELERQRQFFERHCGDNDLSEFLRYVED